MKKAIIVSGYFNPIHKGHLELFAKAKAQADELWVIVNSDLQRELKGSKEFQLEDERLLIVSSLKMVDYAMISVDKDRTVCESIRVLNVKAITKDQNIKLHLLMVEIKIMILYQRLGFVENLVYLY